MWRFGPRRNRWTLAVAALGVCCFTPASAQSPDPSQPPAAGAAEATLLSESEAIELAEEFKQIASEAERRLAALSSDRLSGEPILKASGFDPERIFQWIATETRLTPYRGALRGPAGVLMDRRGNSLDRALALSALLEDAGHETRLARTRLPEPVARQVLERLIAEARASEPTMAAGPDREAAARTREVTEVSLQLVELAGLAREATGPPPAQLVEALRDHWWVEARLGSRWTGLDPVFQGDFARQRPGVQTFTTPASLPKELRHRLRLEVVLERWEASGTVEETALSVDYSPLDHPLGESLELSFLPFSPSWATETEDRGALEEELWAADTATFWRPVARIGGKRIPGRWFSQAGVLTRSPRSWAAAERMDAASKALGRLGSTRPEAPPTHLSGVSLRYTIERPGAPPTVTRREIFDLARTRDVPARLNAEDVRRRGLALQGRTIVLPVSCMLAREAVERALLELWVENRNYFIALAYRAGGIEDPRVPIVLDRGGSYRPIDLLAVGALRHLWSRHADAVYVDRINVLSTHLFLQPANAAATFTTAIDVVVNAVGVLPDGTSDARLVRLEQGVLDTLVESSLFDDEDVRNTYRLFAKRRKEAGRWLTPAASSELESAAHIPERDRARIAAAIARGEKVVIAPATSEIGSEPFVSWWSIDPADGTTLGLGFRGWGQDVPEETKLEIIVDATVEEAVKRMSRKGVCYAYSMATEAVTARLADKMMFASGPGPYTPRPRRAFARACYTLK